MGRNDLGGATKPKRPGEDCSTCFSAPPSELGSNDFDAGCRRCNDPAVAQPTGFDPCKEACMRNRRFATGLGALLVLAASTLPALAQSETKTADDLVSAVVQIKTFINPDGRTVENLGREREGTGIVIDSNGLVLTIGYLMVEAHAAEIVTSE